LEIIVVVALDFAIMDAFVELSMRKCFAVAFIMGLSGLTTDSFD